MHAHEDGHSGCQLPEELRRYYLELMGIQVWADRQAAQSSEVAETPVAEVVTSSTKVQQAVPEANTRADTELWKILQTEVAACRQCELHQSRSQTVFGAGHLDAELLIIGEAPGEEEDAQGQPFVGPAGELLDAMLRAIGLQREQVYITNILKCRPPQNRPPQRDEVMHCAGYLQRQIELLRPRVILAMGKVAAQNLLVTNNTVTALRESQHDYHGIPLLVSYHPAYLLRKPSEKRKSWQDLLRLKAMLA